MIVTIISIIILIFSAVVHEVAHGWMAKRLGDPTADQEGRLTLNPLKHLDPIGSVVLPLLLIITKANFFFAWAKPVPYNPYNLRDRKFGELKVALAGPASNLVIAFVSALFVRLASLNTSINFLQGDMNSLATLTQGSLLASLIVVAVLVCYINIFLAVFNLIPIPPLDGSKILYAFLPARGRLQLMKLEQYSFIILMILIITGIFSFVSLIVDFLFSLLVGTF